MTINQTTKIDSANQLFSKKRRNGVLAVVCISLLMVVAAVASLNVALPNLARSTGATQSQLQWIVDAYGLVFAGLLLPAGSLGDRLGRKGILLFGLLVFGGASIAAMYAKSPSALIALRAVIGVGAAFVMPTTLSIITNIFPPEERGRAVGIWAGVAGGGAMLGLLASGTLLRWYSWKSVFAINVTLAAVALLLTSVVVPRLKSAHAAKLDMAGTLLSTAGLFAFVYSIIEAPQYGWGSARIVSGLAAGVVLLALFVLVELRLKSPMLDPRLFARRGFGVGALSLTMQFLAQFGFLFVSLQYLQLVLSYSPLKASLAILPLALMLMILSPRAPKIARKLGVRRTGSVGLGLMSAGFFVFSTLGAHSSYWHFGIGAILAGLGLGLATAPATMAIVSSLPPEKQGIASAVNDLTREVGAALGIAILGSVLNSAYRSKLAAFTVALPHPLASAAQSSISAAMEVAPHAGMYGRDLMSHAQSAFVTGLSHSLFTGACLLLATAAIVAIAGPKREVDRSLADI